MMTVISVTLHTNMTN